MKIFNRHIALTALAVTSLWLAGCSSTPSGTQKPQGDETSSAPVASGGVPNGLDLSAPDTNPYLSHEVDVPGAARNLFDQAVNAMQGNDWRKAEVVLQQLTTEYPNLSGPFLNLGIVYRQLDNYSDAETAFKRAISANSLNVDAYNQLGLLMREQGRFEEAEKAYLGAIKAWSKHPNSHKNIGILYDLYLGQLEKALQHFEIYQYLQAEPNREVAGWIIDLRRRIGS